MTNQLEGIPEPIIEKMLEYQVAQGNPLDRSVFEHDVKSSYDGMEWVRTPEGVSFWNSVLRYKNFNVFFDKYSKQKEIIGYKLNGVADRLTVDKALGYAMPKYNDSESDYFIKGHLAGTLIQRAKDLKVLDIWFEPVYETVEAVVEMESEEVEMESEEGVFELTVSADGIYYAPEQTWLDVKSIEDMVETPKGLTHTNGPDFGYKVEHRFIDVGCKKNTHISQWKHVLKIYHELKDKSV